MTKKFDTQENHREHVRVSARLYFCVSIINGIDPETKNITYGDCFCTISENLSLGGICVAHHGKVNVGSAVEVSVPSKMTGSECLTCEKSFLYKNELELEAIRGKVVWATESICGIAFQNLHNRNENVLSKYIWEEHLQSVRTTKGQVVRQRKF